MEQLLGDGGHQRPARLRYLIVPFHEAALNLPAVAVNVEFRGEKSKCLLDTADIHIVFVQLEFGQQRQHPLLHGADVVPGGVKDVEAMAPGELALHGVDRLPRLVINVIAVEPREKPLLEK